VAGLSGAVVAGCLFVLAGWLSRHGASPDAEVADVVPVSSQEAHSVVSLWSALGDAAPDPSIADESNVSAADGADATGDEVPDWMLAAVAGVESDDLFDQEPPPHPVPPQDDGDEETL